MVDDGRPGPRAAGIPWAAALDPVANMRVLGDIQRRGLRAAGEIVERLVAQVDGDDTSGAGTSEAPGGKTGEPDLDGLVDLWAVLAKRSLQALARLGETAGTDWLSSQDRAGSSARRTVPTVDVTGASGTPLLRLRGVRAGPGVTEAPLQGATTELWLHNGSANERRDIRLHCGELRSHDGTALSADVLFDPALIDVLPARSSRGIVVAVQAVSDDTAAGVYRSLVLASGLPDVWLPIEVTVER